MAPNEDVTLQTKEIIECLFNLKDGGSDSCLECDSPDPFDAATIAEKLRNVADSFNDDVRFKAALDELKEAAANEAVEAAFGHGVDVLCQSHVAQMPEVAPEMQLIRVSVAFGLFVKQSCPELKMKTQRAMISFLNRRVSSWVAQKGGWVITAVYQNVLEDFMIPSAVDLYGDEDFIFQQDLAPTHAARSTKAWFDAHAITVLDRSANLLDLNPTENKTEN